MQKNRLTFIASFLGLYLISAGVSLLFFSRVSGDLGDNGAQQKRSRINLSAPKTEACPINGMKYTKEEKKIWDERRPLVAIIENHADSRPQSGLSKADVVYEIVAEGGITRFMGVFYCGVIAEETLLAPIRSVRIYFANLAAGYGDKPVFLHQGGANNFCNTCPGGVKPRGQVDKTVDAYAALDKLGWRNGQSGNDMDGGFNIGYPVVERNQYRLSEEAAAWEHSVVANVDEVYKEANKRGFNYKDNNGNAWDEGFKIWKFEDGKAVSNPNASQIAFKFWDNWEDYDVSWKFDPATNSYKRSNGNKAHIDWEFDKPQLSASNVVIMFVSEKGPVDGELHMYYEVIGKGKAIIFKNGEMIEGTWEKPTQLDREVFYDTNGDEIVFNRGPIWIEVLPAGNQVDYN